jgi:DNA primase catalytic subunit
MEAERRTKMPLTVPTTVAAIASEYFASPQFPVESIWRYFSEMCPAEREYGFGLSSRHLCFSNADEMRTALESIRPSRIDVGPIYARPILRDESLPPIVAADWVIDIDIDNLDEAPSTRGCGCVGKAYCSKCWPLVNFAADITWLRMRDVFGADTASRVGIFFSGGRGFHFYLPIRAVPYFASPDRAIRCALRRLLIPDSSAAVTVSRATDGSHDFSLLRTLEIVTNRFVDWYVQVHPLPAARALLAAISSAPTDAQGLASVAVEASTISSANTVSDDAVNRLVEAARAALTIAPRPVYEAAVTCLWPRFDTEATDRPQHMLRVPLGIHDSTGRLSVRVESSFIGTSRSHIPTLATFYPLDGSAPLARFDAQKLIFDPPDSYIRAVADFEAWVRAAIAT